MATSPEAFVLVAIPNASLAYAGAVHKGTLELHCVTIPLSESIKGAPPTPVDQDVYLVLHLNSVEIALEPSRIVQKVDANGWCTYTFQPTINENAELSLVLPSTSSGALPPQVAEQLETFDGVLAQYADVRGTGSDAPPRASSPQHVSALAGGRGYSTVDQSAASNDLRGHLVMINEDTGEIIGELDEKFKVREDIKLQDRGNERAPVIIEMPNTTDNYGREQDTTLEMFVQAIPPDQQDWITKSATIVSHAISTTTNLLLTTITMASSYYISNSTPSPHHSSAGSGASTPGAPPPTPPRALVYLTSERTRKNLASAHAVSGQAVKVSVKTVATIDGMIRRAVGGKPKRAKFSLQPATNQGPLPAGGAVVQPQPIQGYATSLAPPPYGAPFGTPEKPSLPPRKSSSPVPPLPPRTQEGAPGGFGKPPPPLKLSTKERILFSADLILSTIDDSAIKLLDGGTSTIGKVMHHKYGQEAAASSLLVAGTARNIGLVYIDMSGVGRRALLKKAGKHFVKARIS